MEEITIKSKKSFSELYGENKEYIFPIVFYFAGLLIGVLFYSNINIDKLITGLFTTKNAEFLPLFINKFCVYISVYSVTVLLGMCLIGFPFINIVPLLLGMEISIKISYYYVNYGAKGIGYALLLIIPEYAAFFSILIYSIKSGNELSKYIYSKATKKSDIADDINIKLYLKSFLIYAVLITLISIINALAEFLMVPIISI